MLIINEINTGEMKQGSIEDEVIGFEKAKIITFVSSLNVVETFMSKFKEIELINGSITPSAVDVFKRFTDISFRINDFDSLSESTKTSIVKGDYKVYIPKSKIIHSKIYLFENDREYKALIGSANLTSNGLYGGNHEYLEMKIGEIGDKYHKNLVSYFHDLKAICDDYVDVDEIQSKNKKEYIKDFMLDLHDYVKNNRAEFQGVINSRREEASKTVEVVAKEREESDREISVIFSKSGAVLPRGNFESKLKEYLNVKISADMKYEPDEDYWPYDENRKSIIIDKTPLNEFDVPPTSPKVILDIIDSYGANKHEDERHQVYTAFMYVFMSPYLWKIRNIYIGIWDYQLKMYLLQ